MRRKPFSSICIAAVIMLVAAGIALAGGTAAKASGGSDSLGANSVSTDWYFAEGTTREGFTTYIAILNPERNDASVTFTYMLGKGDPVVRTHSVAAKSRFTIDIASDVGPGKDVATFIHSTAGVVAERPMYFWYQNKWDGGHDSMGALALADDWYFAEGTTRDDFKTYLAVMNPSTTAAQVSFTYMLGSGEPLVKTHTVAAKSRYTIDVADDIGAGRDVSTFIHSSVPLVAERPMYFDYSGAWDGGHDSLGALQLSTDWYFAEGTTRAGFVTYLAIVNPGTVDATVECTYLLGSGSPVKRTHVVRRRSRFTLDVSADVGTGKDVATLVKSSVPVVAERPMYFLYAGKWDGGHDSLGAPGLNSDWYFAEGTTRDGFGSYLAVVNPAAAEATLTITYMLGSGDPVTAMHTIGAYSRFTVDLANEVGAGKDVSMFVHSSLPVIAERPIYFKLPIKALICLDPGHSGHTGDETDPSTGLNVGDNSGCSGELQAIWNLAVVETGYLQRAGYDVILTKGSASEYVDLRKRADLANTCAVWIRLHYDDTGFTGVMRPPANGARCPANDPTRITVVDPAVASGSDALAKVLAPWMGLGVRDDTGGTSQGNATPAGHPTCLIGSCLSKVPVVCIEHRQADVVNDPEAVAFQLVNGLDAYFGRP
jgi:N-acetylmuramoyl-L-alanine amidase